MNDKDGNDGNKEGTSLVVLAAAMVLVALSVFLLLKLKSGHGKLRRPGTP